MVHTEVYNRFENMMPIYANKVTDWFPNGYNSIRVRLDTNEEFIFSIYADDSWRFETVDSFLNSLRGES